MTPRFHCPVPMRTGDEIALPDAAVRHAQVLRLQPGSIITLFDGGGFGLQGGEFEAQVRAMGRGSVRALVGAHRPIEREPQRRIRLCIGMPANERMDWLVEKATELGVAAIEPLMMERTVVRLDGERARRRSAHWAGIAAAACEQCGRNRLPVVEPAVAFPSWLAQERGASDGQPGRRLLLLSLAADAQDLRELASLPAVPGEEVRLLCGPEGGLSPREEAGALALGYRPVGLGPRVLRAETAALAALTLLA